MAGHVRLAQARGGGQMRIGGFITGLAAKDVIGGNLALAIRGARQRDEGPGLSDGVAHFHGVACRPDGWISRLQLVVDANAAR